MVFLPESPARDCLIHCRRPVFHMFGKSICLPHTSVAGAVYLLPAAVVVTPQVAFGKVRIRLFRGLPQFFQIIFFQPVIRVYKCNVFALGHQHPEIPGRSHPIVFPVEDGDSGIFLRPFPTFGKRSVRRSVINQKDFNLPQGLPCHRFQALIHILHHIVNGKDQGNLRSGAAAYGKSAFLLFFPGNGMYAFYIPIGIACFPQQFPSCSFQNFFFFRSQACFCPCRFCQAVFFRKVLVKPFTRFYHQTGYRPATRQHSTCQTV